jgi:hypothetical protein
MKKCFEAIQFIVLFSLSASVGAQSNQSTWTWINGNKDTASTVVFTGVYGVQGTPAASNKPGARSFSYSWRDHAGNFWLFGGHGYGNSGQGHLNDLWKYDVTTNMWTWIRGDSSVNNTGSYNTQGVPSPSNYPRGRHDGITWTDAAGNFWLFGGRSITGQGSLFLNDVWRYRIAQNDWTWMKGDSLETFSPPVYGTQGVASATNTPSGRFGSMAWSDSLGNFWLLGGGGKDSRGDGIYNDLWKYTPQTNQWTWVKGDSTVDPAGSWGSQGVTSPGNKPGARYYGSTWTDASGNLWLYGGFGRGRGFWGTLNDLWKYDVASNQWTWMKGNDSIYAVYGAQGVTAPTNLPPPKFGAVSWSDAAGNFWLFGGGVTIDIPYDFYNDLWSFSPSTNN